MNAEVITAVATGVAFLVALLAIGCYMAFRRDPSPVPPEAMLIFRVILALAASGFAAMLPGFLQIEGKLLSFTVRAAGTLAVFLVIYRINPPERFEKRLPKRKTPHTVVVSEDRIERDKQPFRFPRKIVASSLILLIV